MYAFFPVPFATTLSRVCLTNLLVSSLIVFLINLGLFDEVSKVLEGNDEEDVEVYIQKNYLMINVNNTKVITRLLEGEFINYKQVIPQSINTTITSNKEGKTLEEGKDVNVIAKQLPVKVGVGSISSRI
mgnify:CR=1 FL=1